MSLKKGVQMEAFIDIVNVNVEEKKMFYHKLLEMDKV
jgi:hypothetical protein